MSVNYFLDTNVLVYLHDASAPAKQERAFSLLAAGIRTGKITLSTQVLTEYSAVLLRKLKFPVSSIVEEIHYLSCCRIEEIGLNTILEALRVHNENQISIWDALIVASASQARCELVYTEDLNHDQVIEGVRICNPFR